MTMTINRIIAATVAAVLMSSAGSAQGAQQISKQEKNKKSRTESTRLQDENARLREKIDSLTQELDRYRAELGRTDSLTTEMLDIYEENEDKIAAGLSPEDYTPEVSDSLLNIWYAHRVACTGNQEEYDMDSVKFKSDVPDEVYIERIKRMNSFITLPYNEIVKNYIILYSEKMPTKMSHILGLSEYYMPIFNEIFNKYDLPEELKAMAVIESALNPTAVSRAGAKGMWQFMYSTAKIYGLHIDSFVDERLDPVKSAEAAARYLKDSYDIFGDWNLAIASYNCGAGNVNKAIRRSGGKRSFWDIWPYLPRETRGYVPAFVGALYTMTYYKEHGIKPESIETPAIMDTLKINKMLHLKQVSHFTGAPIDELRNLNPQYRHDIIPGNDREYILRLPYSYTNAFIEYEDSLYTHKAEEFFNPVTIKKIKDGADGERIVHKVKNGEYLGKIAAKYHVSVAQLKRWNNLKNNNIRVGQKLIVYRGGKGPVQTAAASQTASATAKPAQAAPAQQSNAAASRTGSSSVYIVKQGDVLGKIAAQHNVSVEDIKKWNNLKSNNISIGQKLIVRKTEAPAGNYTIYTVKDGDSLYTIAKNYPGVSAQDIMNFNGIGSNIKPGMKLKIPTE